MALQCASCGVRVQDVFNSVCAGCGAALTENTIHVEDPAEAACANPTCANPMCTDSTWADEVAWVPNVVKSLICLGIAGVLCGIAYYLYLDVLEWERTGGTRRMHAYLEALPYRLFGPSGPMLAPLTLAALLVYVAIGTLFDLPGGLYTPPKTRNSTGAAALADSASLTQPESNGT